MLIISKLFYSIEEKEYLRTNLIIVKSLKRIVLFLFFYLLLAKYLYDFKWIETHKDRLYVLDFIYWHCPYQLLGAVEPAKQIW